MPPSLRPMLLVVLFALFAGSGCATVQTVDAAYQRQGNNPLFIMSGTRFDLEAIGDRERAQRRFGIEGPWLPWADLPASFVLDVLLLPMLMWVDIAR